jgi:hypothetical protein
MPHGKAYIFKFFTAGLLINHSLNTEHIAHRIFIINIFTEI